VFGDERPLQNVNHGAGIDVSPAVRDYLGLGSLGLVDWRFIEEAEVPIGPWLLASCLESEKTPTAELEKRLDDVLESTRKTPPEILLPKTVRCVTRGEISRRNRKP